MSLRILVVDDQGNLASKLKLLLETGDNEVTLAGSAAAAKQLMSGGQYHVVITDMKMESETAGYDVIDAARALSQSPAVLILTAYPVLARDWQRRGAQAILTKPVKLSVLLDTMQEISGLRLRP